MMVSSAVSGFASLLVWLEGALRELSWLPSYPGSWLPSWMPSWLPSYPGSWHFASYHGCRRCSSYAIRDLGLGFGVWGLGFRVWGLGLPPLLFLRNKGCVQSHL